MVQREYLAEGEGQPEFLANLTDSGCCGGLVAVDSTARSSPALLVGGLDDENVSLVVNE